jgi:hypothetical protein
MVKGGHSHKQMAKGQHHQHTPRVATPPYDCQLLDNVVRKYIEKAGVTKALDLGMYNQMSLNSAAHGFGILQNSKLLKALLSVSPYAMFKAGDLKQALVMAASSFSNLVPGNQMYNVSGWANLKAERLMVLLNHLRRISNSPTRLRQASNKLDAQSKEALLALTATVKEASELSCKAAMSDLSIEALEQDASLDRDLENCVPMPPCKKSKAYESCVAEEGGSLTAADACSFAEKPIAAMGIKYVLTLAAAQSYIQYRTPGTPKKKLLIAVSAKQSSRHKQIVKLMYEHFQKNPSLDVGVAKSLRSALLA